MDMELCRILKALIIILFRNVEKYDSNDFETFRQFDRKIQELLE